MRIELDFTKSIEENASDFFEKAKQSKKKAEGARKAMEASEKKLDEIEIEISKKQEQENLKEKIKDRKKEWFEKFRWFYTSDGFLVIGGRDATTNEIIIKKHTDKEDIVFHTEMAGSPFVVIKAGDKKPSKAALDETAQFTACYSKAWKMGRTVSDVFYVNPEQVTKEAPSGEYINKGSFMIYGKKNIVTVNVRLFIGKTEEGKIMSGPEASVKERCSEYIEIFQGEEKTSNVAKKIKAKLNADDLDDIIKVLPVGSRLKN